MTILLFSCPVYVFILRFSVAHTKVLQYQAKLSCYCTNLCTKNLNGIGMIIVFICRMENTDGKYDDTSHSMMDFNKLYINAFRNKL